ncbi:MAG: hypothetical protein ABSF85_15990 [Terriglobales bacterium]
MSLNNIVRLAVITAIGVSFAFAQTLEKSEKTVKRTIRFKKDNVVTALKSAMESEGCEVMKDFLGKYNIEQIECKRTGAGDENVTAQVVARHVIWSGRYPSEYDETDVWIQTKTGHGGQYWSTPIFNGMMERLINGYPMTHH